MYIPSPSSHKDIIEIYKDCFGDKESIELVRAILLSEDTKDTINRIEKKVAKILRFFQVKESAQETFKTNRVGRIL